MLCVLFLKLFKEFNVRVFKGIVQNIIYGRIFMNESVNFVVVAMRYQLKLHIKSHFIAAFHNTC